jgi:hypothetical protein
MSPDTWGRLREHFDLDRRRRFELSAAAFTDLAQFTNAMAKLEEAQRDLNAGRAGGVAAKCRIVLDGVLADLGYLGPNNNALYEAVTARLRQVGFTEDIAAGMEQILRGVRAVTSSEHHPSDYRWARAHAEFMLALAVSLASYVAHCRRAHDRVAKSRSVRCHRRHRARVHLPTSDVPSFTSRGDGCSSPRRRNTSTCSPTALLTRTEAGPHLERRRSTTRSRTS